MVIAVSKASQAVTNQFQPNIERLERVPKSIECFWSLEVRNNKLEFKGKFSKM